MPTQRGVLREVAWSEVAPWLVLFRAVKLAFDPRKLILAAAGFVLTWGGWCGVANLFSGSQHRDVQDKVDHYRSWIADAEATKAVTSFDRPNSDTARVGFWHIADVPLRLSRPFVDIFRQDTSLTGIAMSVLCAVWALAVWSLFGGAITRIAAMQISQEQRYSLVASLRYAIRKWPSYFAAPLFPFGFMMVGLIPLAIAGWISRPDAGFVVAAIGWPIVLLISLGLAILLIGLLLGWPLMFAATSLEGQDAFDAFNRLHAYVYQRFFQLVFYVAVAVVLGIIGWVAAALLAEFVLYLAAWGASWGAGGVRSDEIFSMSHVVEGAAERSTGGRILAFWSSCVQLLVLGFGYAYFWTATTAIYLLVRRDCDGVPLDTIHQETKVEPKNLPRLVRDQAGVPVLSPEEREELSRPGPVETAE